ncbi:hypothetical protein NE237_019496 [Protea cynaroides]|uniref:Uncharacterized protein n=1 Tax=Protea cynaroides TaxID=273540 RepID=A0A9Q0GP05_9MAGN|nr:hypothetical protein NE237_019496 [Protea cynaroides]
MGGRSLQSQSSRSPYRRPSFPLSPVLDSTGDNRSDSRTVVPEDIINNVINFVDRPYGTHLPGYIKPLLFNDREGERLVRPSNPAEDHEINDFVRIVTPGDLIAIITSEEKQHVPVVQYRPDRVAKQFGLDQGISRVIPHNSDHEAACLSEVQGTRKKIGGKKRKGEVENVDVSVSAAGDSLKKARVKPPTTEIKIAGDKAVVTAESGKVVSQKVETRAAKRTKEGGSRDLG